MSKIANRIIQIPPQVKVNLQEKVFIVEGPHGKAEKLLIPPTVEVIQQENQIITKSDNLTLAGTYNALISNLFKGIIEGYEKILEVKGVGYKVALKDNKLEFFLGKSHSDCVEIPPELQIKLEGNKIIIKGIDKQKVSSFAANNIKCLRLPSIYKKNKGIYYLGEEATIKLRPGKSLNK